MPDEKKRGHLQELIVLNHGEEEKARETLKYITLYRVAAHLQGAAREAKNKYADTECTDVRERILNREPYAPLHARVKEIHIGSSERRQIHTYGIATTNGTLQNLRLLSDVIDLVNPKSSFERFSLCLDNRYLRCSILDSNLVSEPIPPPAIGYVETFTSHPDAITGMMRKVQERKDAPEGILVGKTPLHIYFKTNMDIVPTPREPTENLNYRDPVYIHFLEKISSKVKR
jgi:hypothetical protein